MSSDKCLHADCNIFTVIVSFLSLCCVLYVFFYAEYQIIAILSVVKLNAAMMSAVAPTKNSTFIKIFFHF